MAAKTRMKHMKAEAGRINLARLVAESDPLDESSFHVIDEVSNLGHRFSSDDH
jgi:hypothetical protein